MLAPRMRPTSSFLTIGFALMMLAFGACSSAPNTQYLPIGQRCNSSDDCGTTPYDCVTAGYPGGYCERNCAVDGDCPLDSYCASSHCRRKCTDITECREIEGYVCRTTGATGPYCDVPVGGK